MLGTNLSTRPFYNERAVGAVLGLLAVVVALATVYNVVTGVQLLRRTSQLGAEAAQADRERAAASQRAARARAALARQDVEGVMKAARQVSALVDLRTFSWTELFNDLERTLPADVMLVAVQPRSERGRMTVSLQVVGRSVESLDAFMQRLEATGRFRRVFSQAEAQLDDGTYEATIASDYSPGAAGAAVRPASQGAGETR
ncbi:MAG: hypothetical protein KJ061_00930 [Vicinamibacteraceae bacterium]|nr:hypothetical protein [Vicinamibacteraceae bacterium]